MENSSCGNQCNHLSKPSPIDKNQDLEEHDAFVGKTTNKIQPCIPIDDDKIPSFDDSQIFQSEEDAVIDEYVDEEIFYNDDEVFYSDDEILNFDKCQIFKSDEDDSEMVKRCATPALIEQQNINKNVLITKLEMACYNFNKILDDFQDNVKYFTRINKELYKYRRNNISTFPMFSNEDCKLLNNVDAVTRLNCAIHTYDNNLKRMDNIYNIIEDSVKEFKDQSQMVSPTYDYDLPNFKCANFYINSPKDLYEFKPLQDQKVLDKWTTSWENDSIWRFELEHFKIDIEQITRIYYIDAPYVNDVSHTTESGDYTLIGKVNYGMLELYFSLYAKAWDHSIMNYGLFFFTCDPKTLLTTQVKQPWYIELCENMSDDGFDVEIIDKDNLNEEQQIILDEFEEKLKNL